MTRLCQHFGKRGFTNIFGESLRLASANTLAKRGAFAHYNGSRTFVDTFDINAYDDLPSPSSLRGYINPISTEIHYTFIDHFGSRGSPTTLVQTSTSTTTTTTTSTTPRMTGDSVTSASQEGLGEHTRGQTTLEGEVFCSTHMREDLEAHNNLWL